MTRDKAIAELVRIWHSPHLDLSLKAGLAEAIDTLKESNLNDSLVRGEVDACKESESKLDLISRADAIEVLTETIATPSVTLDTLVMRIDALPSAEAVQRWIPVSERLPNIGDTFLVTVMVGTRIKTDVASNFGSYIDGFWDTFNDWIEDEECHVTAWMPLPEPYEGGDSK